MDRAVSRSEESGEHKTLKEVMKKMKRLVLFVLVSAVQSVHASVDPNPMIQVFPSAGPPTYASSFLIYSTNAAMTLRDTKGLPTGTRTHPTDVRLLQVMTVDDLLTTVSQPFYRRVFNPPPPFDKERGGTIWWWLDVEAAPGKTVSLAGIQGTLSSTDSNNLLGKSVNFSTNGYGVAAIGVMEDGSLINQGQPSQTQVKRVIVAIGSKSFPVTNQGEIATVDNYLAQFPNWSTSISVKVGSTTVVKTLTKGLLPPRLFPSITFVNQEKRFVLVAENNGTTQDFVLQSSTDLINWTNGGTIRAGQTVSAPITSTSSQKAFFRLR